MLFGIGIWRMIVLDWRGIVFFSLSMIFLLLKSGLKINTEDKSLKKYIGFLILKIGKLVNIESVVELQIIRTKETRGMNVLSISRSDTYDIYKLFMVLPHRNIELMSGERDLILSRAEQISSSLEIIINDGSI